MPKVPLFQPPNLDVTRLGETSRFFHNVALDQHFWRLRTLSTFRLPPQPIRQTGWLDLYKHLSTARVFTWGSNEFGRLGHNYEAETRGPVYRVHSQVRTPTEITSLRNEVVVDLGCGGWSTWALTSRGKVYGWGKVCCFDLLIPA
jgi:SCF-associated factor 1